MPVDEADAAEQHHQNHEIRRWPSERCGVSVAEKIVGSRSSALSAVMRAQYTEIMAKNSSTASASGQKRASQSAQGQRAKVKPKRKRAAADTKAAARRVAAMDNGRDRGSVPPLQGRQPGAEERAATHQSIHAAGCGGAVGAGDRCRRQQGDAGAVCARRHAGKDGRARRGPGARPDQDHRPVPHQSQERRRAVAKAGRPSMAGKCRARARRWRRCPASAARPPMSCSMLRSASRPSRSIPTSSASAIAPGWRPARRRSKSRRNWSSVVPAQYKLHAHHWLILHGRYTCVARRPLCEKCIITDLCQWPGKTVVQKIRVRESAYGRLRACQEREPLIAMQMKFCAVPVCLPMPLLHGARRARA